MSLCRATAFAVTSALALTLLAACSPGDVEFNGKLFDTLGVNATSSREVPKVAERRPLVLPPDAARLPPPGAAPAPQQDASFPVDPEKRKTMDAAALAKAQEAYCRDGSWKEKALVKDGKLDKSAERAELEKRRAQAFNERDRQILTNGASNAEYHYLGSAKILGGIGKAFAEALHELIRGEG